MYINTKWEDIEEENNNTLLPRTKYRNWINCREHMACVPHLWHLICQYWLHAKCRVSDTTNQNKILSKRQLHWQRKIKCTLRRQIKIKKNKNVARYIPWFGRSFCLSIGMCVGFIQHFPNRTTGTTNSTSKRIIYLMMKKNSFFAI